MDNTRACLNIIGNNPRERAWLITQEGGDNSGSKVLEVASVTGIQSTHWALASERRIQVCRWVQVQRKKFLFLFSHQRMRQDCQLRVLKWFEVQIEDGEESMKQCFENQKQRYRKSSLAQVNS